MISSPTARRNPRPRAFSLTSPGPAAPSNSVKGARMALVTRSLASSREALCVATVMSARSPADGRSGSSRPEALSQAAKPALAVYGAARRTS